MALTLIIVVGYGKYREKNGRNSLSVIFRGFLLREGSQAARSIAR
jgi:hypothetical protein